MSATEGHKRRREDEEASPEAKRIHADFLLDILTGEVSDTGDCDPPADRDLDAVIRSFEEEISLPPEIYAVEGVNDEEISTKEKIGYLQEASDDELGIPPPGGPSSEGSGSGGYESAEEFGFGQIWGFEDDGLMVYGVLPEEDAGDMEEFWWSAPV
ncbi:hypothetical protein HPP92_021598 [Vanilla planifolia]|uniref:Uncharacterized protein n=1 Tax=Vanilla planifolia TaxID=51239 RepID=A0A835PVP3_VANPL|nr:hypothetical protein HPP92_021598 [Vanilla planifolia]